MYPSTYPPKGSASSHLQDRDGSWLHRFFPPKRKIVVSIEERTLFRKADNNRLNDRYEAIATPHRRPQSPTFAFPSPAMIPPPATRSFFSSLAARVTTALLCVYMTLAVHYMISVDPARISDRSASVPVSPHSTILSHSQRRIPARINELEINGTKAQPTGTSNSPAMLNPSAVRAESEPTEAHTGNEVSIDHPHIPRILIFTHSVNLLLIAGNQSALEGSDGETKVLASNVEKSILHHPGAQVRFLTNHDCEDAILRVYSNREDSSNKSQRLLHYFRQETTGMYKGDLCRGVALVETGGMYLDVDLGVRMNLFRALQNTTTFATVRVHKRSHNVGSFFQAFMAAAPRHPILERYVDLFLDYYDGKLPQYRGKPLGVVLLKHAHDQVLAAMPALNATVELWQEVQYDPKLQDTVLKHVPPPTWGTRRACKFIVVAPAASPRKGAGRAVVPLYSRIANSRMCPA
jgi:Glycosyltransferase sugar-binding region containing DXD motif